MIKDFTKKVVSLKFSVFRYDGKVASAAETDFELIRIPGFGRYRKPTEGIGRFGNFRMTIFDFRMGKRTTKYAKYANGEARCWESEAKVAVDGSYRQLTAVRKKYLNSICSAIEGFGAVECDCISYGNTGYAMEVMMKIREMQEVGVKNVLTGGGLNPFVWCSVDKDGVATERLPEHFSQSAIL